MTANNPNEIRMNTINNLLAERDARLKQISDLTERRTQLLPEFFISGAGADEIKMIADQIDALRKRYVDDFALAMPLIEDRLRSHKTDIRR